MKSEAGAIAIKVAATGVTAVGFAAMTPWAWVAAFGGATASYYFEPKRRPSGIWAMGFGIAAMAFAAVVCALGAPYAPAMFGFDAGSIAREFPLDVRTGIFGITVGTIYQFGRKWVEKRAGIEP